VQLAVEGEARDVDPPCCQQRGGGEKKPETRQPDEDPESEYTGSCWRRATACAETVRGGEHGVRCLWKDSVTILIDDTTGGPGGPGSRYASGPVEYDTSTPACGGRGSYSNHRRTGHRRTS
jgi:hypothetical protein